MYVVVLSIHNIVRWIVLILGLLVVVRGLIGWFGGRDWSDTDRRVGLFFTISMDVQALLGLLLYLFFSPFTTIAFQDFAAAMGNAGLRFFALEHVFYMVLALVFGHVGSVMARRATEAVSKHRRATIWYGLAVILILLGMPWMRPFFPGF